MTIDTVSLAAQQLLDVWSGQVGASIHEREEALWEYWRRVANGQIEFSELELEAALESGVRGLGNVVGQLARSGTLPCSRLEWLRALLRRVGTDDTVWAENQINAREAINALKTECRSSAPVNLEPLLAKGVAWAATLAMPYMSSVEQEQLLLLAEERKIFSRAQRHELKSAIRANPNTGQAGLTRDNLPRSK